MRLNNNKILFPLTILFVIFFQRSHGQEFDCQKFKNGIFELKNKESKISHIKRYGENQSEITDGNEDSTTYKVNWINDCVYTLTPTEKTYKAFPFLPQNAVLTVTIIKVNTNSYVQRTTSNFSDMKLTSEMVKIDDIKNQ